MSEPTLRQAGATVITLVIVVKIIGFVREAVVAGVYGTTRTVDTYLAAVAVPAILVSIVYQALPNALVPLFQPGRASSRIRRLVVQLLVSALVVSGLVWLSAPWIASLTNSGFDAAAQADTVTLIRISSIAVLLAMLEAIGRSRLIAQRKFGQSGISQLWSSVVVILAIALFADAGAYALMWGLVIGTGVIAVWNLLPLGRRDTTPRPPAVLQPDSETDGGWLIVVLLISTAGLLYGLIDRHLGSYLAEGSLAALQYGNLIANQPVAICGITIATAIFPYLAERINADDRDGSLSVLDRAIRWAMLGGVPSAVLTVFFAPEILEILLERGSFDAASRTVTSGVLAVYGFWMIPAVLSSVVVKVHYSTRGTRALIWATIVGLLIKTGASFWWVTKFGIAGLAASSAAALVAYIIILTVLLPHWLRLPLWRGWVRTLAVLAVLTTLGALTGWAATHVFTALPGKWDAYLPVGLAVIATTLLLLFVAPGLGVQEPRTLLAAAVSKVSPRRRDDADRSADV